MRNEDVIAVLNGLIDICKDGEAGFRTCADDVDGGQLQRFLENRAHSCASAAEDLQQLVRSYGGVPDEGGGVVGLLHRRWVDLKALLARHDEVAVLEECVRGEEVAVAEYRAALEKDLPPNVRTVVERQYLGVLHNCDEVRQLRDQYRALS